MLRATKVGGAAGWPGWLAGWLACRLKFIDLIVKVIRTLGMPNKIAAFEEAYF